ncbi:fimbrial biogenesis chaperone [Pedobacter sp. 22163]|uniref:fimbrial biogenesis chaperone n=1 Tax=Pedobacter sp. 22163 TaxID=3453883 RepID=UPI003F831A9A
MKKIFCFMPLLMLMLSNVGHAQTGLSVTPPRVYFTVAPGESQRQKITVSNVSKTSTLDLSISLNDWSYDEKGNNLIHNAGSTPTSCAKWVAILPSSFFSLAPGEHRDIEIQLAPPANLKDSIAVHTAMLYVSQLNPVDDVSQKGTNIKVAVRTGIKLYQRLPISRNANLDIENFAKVKEELVLKFANIGNVWADGTASCELLNRQTGKKTTLKDIIFYSLPGDKRDIYFTLPQTLEKGEYVASAVLNYGDDATVKLAELEFKHE